MSFKVGDKVKVYRTGSYDWNSDMDQYVGRELTIEKVKDDDGAPNGKGYKVKENYYIWYEDSLKKKTKGGKMGEGEKKEVNRHLMKILVIPDELKSLVLETISQAKQETARRIFEEWGFGETLEKGKGAIILLWGMPGVGKTMCAEAIAEILKKSFLMLGTKDFQSAIPGQTEKNIQAAFAEAKEKDLVVILDECDSVVYNRNEVGAILGAEINCLLTEIERFDGVCILTTNRSERLDPALARRVCLKLEFSKPDKKARAKIWRNLIPRKAPLARSVDFEKLARYELTGGQIKNAILIGARKAACAKKKVITYSHLLEGIKRELLGESAWDMSRKYRIVGEDVVMSEMIEGEEKRKCLK